MTTRKKKNKLKHHSFSERKTEDEKKFKLLNYVALVGLFYFYLPFNNDLIQVIQISEFNFAQ